MSLAIATTVFALVFPAELPDKTALATLILGTRVPAGLRFAAVAAAFALHVGFVILAGVSLAAAIW